ncbi:hypothetical protein CDO26_36415 (plasmid) [Sinorhizobium meliloti]|nr:hypothetical protein CDO26_36415 [Sinorhizobium meliloti]
MLNRFAKVIITLVLSQQIGYVFGHESTARWTVRTSYWHCARSSMNRRRNSVRDLFRGCAVLPMSEQFQLHARKTDDRVAFNDFGCDTLSRDGQL